MLELMKGIRSIIEAAMAVRPGEKVLIVADNEGATMYLSNLIMGVVNSMGNEVVMIVTSPRETTAQEPPASVAAAMKHANAIFCVSDRGYMGHTAARREATNAGARFYQIAQIPLDDLRKGVSAADLRIIKERTEKVASKLTQTKMARVTSPAGTNLTLSLAGRQGQALHPLGFLVSLPYYAEAAIAPVEGTAEGVVVIDVEICNWGYLLREPVRYTVKAGKVVDITGGAQDVERLRKLAAQDEGGTNIAELGIGTSHIIPYPMYGTRRDAARIGTAHIAIGRNNEIGGKTWSHIHVDGLMSQPTIELDDTCILKGGSLLI